MSNKNSVARKLMKRLKPLRHQVNSHIAKYSTIGNDEVYDPNMFEYLKPLQEKWKEIQAEADQVMQHENVPSLGSISKDHQRLDAEGKWKSFILWGYGFRSEQNCSRCPVTASLVDSIPGLLTAMFSIHEPGAHLPRHRGVTKGMVTYHLGIHIPENCYIEVEDKRYYWQEGKFFVFDDTYYHEVFNRSDQNRIILLLHIRRPLRQPGKFFQDTIFWLLQHSPFVTETKRELNV